jgi:hypothetical protein
MTTASAASTTASTAISAAPATTAAAFCLRTCFIHHEIASAKILTVQRIHRAIRIIVAIHFDECEPARLSRETVAD